MTGRPKKRLFIGMLSLTAVLMAAILYAIWYIGVPGLRSIQPMLPWIIGAVFTVLVLGAFFSIFNMVLAVAGCRTCRSCSARRTSSSTCSSRWPCA